MHYFRYFNSIIISDETVSKTEPLYSNLQEPLYSNLPDYVTSLPQLPQLVTPPRAQLRQDPPPPYSTPSPVYANTEAAPSQPLYANQSDPLYANLAKALSQPTTPTSNDDSVFKVTELFNNLSNENN